MNITTKKVEDTTGNTSLRYFGETKDGFDGTAQGYGYKSKQKLMKAYWFHQNKHKIKGLKSEAKQFLKDNPKIKKIVEDYFSEDNCFYAMKDGEILSIKNLIIDLKTDDALENKSEIIDILNKNKHLWKTIERKS